VYRTLQPHSVDSGIFEQLRTSAENRPEQAYWVGSVALSSKENPGQVWAEYEQTDDHRSNGAGEDGTGSNVFAALDQWMKLGRGHIAQELECSVDRFGGPYEPNGDHDADPLKSRDVKSKAKSKCHTCGGSMDSGIVLRNEHRSNSPTRVGKAAQSGADREGVCCGIASQD
jgi:hypothetical protein